MSVYKKQNPERFSNIPTVTTAVGSGASFIDGKSGNFSFAAVIDPPGSGDEANIISSIYLPAINVYVVGWLDDDAQTSNLTTFTVGDGGGLTLGTTIILSGTFQVISKNIAQKGDATIAVMYGNTINRPQLYEATITAAGAFTSTFTTQVNGGASTSVGVTYNEQEDRWIGLDQVNITTNISSVIPGTTTLDGTDTRVSSQNNRLAGSSHSNDKVVIVDGNVATVATVDAAGGTVTFEDADDVSIAVTSAIRGFIYNAANDNHMLLEDGNLHVLTLSGNVVTFGAAQNVTGDISSTLQGLAHNEKFNLYYLVGLHFTPNIGNGYVIFSETGGTITTEESFLFKGMGSSLTTVATQENNIALFAGGPNPGNFGYGWGGKLSNNN